MIKFLSLASGSRGNCYYVDYGDTSILIDGGVGIRNLNKILKDYAISLKDIKAVFTKGIMNGRDVEIVALNRTEPTGVFEI